MARTAKPKSDVNRNVVSLKVTLRDTKPPVWRRLLVPGETTLGGLHRAIQAAMGWEDYHLHTFDIEGRQYGDPRAVDDVADEKRVTLNGLINSGVTRFTYTYDFGDNWEHVLLIEKRLPIVEALSRPTSRFPSFSDSTEHLGKDGLCCQPLGELVHQRAQPVFWHGRDELVEHVTLPEQ
jgi:hypothetical protein